VIWNVRKLHPFIFLWQSYRRMPAWLCWTP